MSNKLLFSIGAYFILNFAFSQVGVNTPAPSSTLDVVATNPTGTTTNVDGILIPRVTRQRAQSMTLVPTSTMIYVNEVVTGTTTGTTVNVTSVGFYFFNGTIWEKISTGLNTNWSLTGNAGTTAATNFLGTTDAQDIRFRTNNTNRWNISDANSGQLQSYSRGTASLPTYSFQSDTNTGIYSPFADAMDFSTTGIARFRIPYDNQVHALSLGTEAIPFYSFAADTNTGIFSSGADALDFSTGGLARFRIPNTFQVHALSLGTAALPFYTFSTDIDTGMFSSGANTLNFSTNAIERVRMGLTETVVNDLSNDYDFRVESDTRTSALHVDASENLIRFGTNFTASDWANATVVAGTTVDYVVDFDNGFADGTAIGVGSVEFLVDLLSETAINNDFSPTANITYDLGGTYSWDDVYADDFWNVSDARLKTEIKDIHYGLKDIMKLHPVAYKWKKDNMGKTIIPIEEREQKIGFLAQEVQSTFPELVKEEDWKPKDESNPDIFVKKKREYLAVNYVGMVPLLVKGMQEQQKIIEEQNLRIEKLEKAVEELLKKQ